MKEFDSLINTLERLLAPDGCPWDREQTMQSMRPSLVEECFETIEAIDLADNQQMQEEIGDLLFNVVFLCKLAEKEGRFHLEDVLKHLVAKLVRRHPHVFGGGQLETTDDVLRQWDQIKQAEKKEEHRSALDGIPKGLPALARAQKIAKKLAKHSFTPQTNAENSPEGQMGDLLWKSVQDMAQQDIQAEEALRKRLTQIESEFRGWEHTLKTTEAQ